MQLPLLAAVRNASLIGRRAARAMAAKKASDHWKEKAVQAYAARMSRAALMLAGGFGLIAAVGWGMMLGAEWLAPGTTTALFSFPGLLLSMVAAIIYMIARQRFVRR